MKLTITLLSLASLLRASDPPAPIQAKVDFQAKYTKALIDLLAAKANDEGLETQYKDMKAKTTDALAKANTAIQEALQAKGKECAELTPAQQLDGKVLTDTGALTCGPVAPQK